MTHGKNSCNKKAVIVRVLINLRKIKIKNIFDDIHFDITIRSEVNQYNLIYRKNGDIRFGI